MILEEETKEKYNYYSNDLSPKSYKHILAACGDCGKVRITTMHAYRELCPSCARKGINNPNYGKYGKNASGYKEGCVKCICFECDRTFEVDQYIFKRGGGKYCSKLCAGKARRGKNHYRFSPPVKCFCKTCGDKFEVSQSRIKKGGGCFCSLKCAGKSHSGKNNPFFGKHHTEKSIQQIKRIKQVQL